MPTVYITVVPARINTPPWWEKANKHCHRLEGESDGAGSAVQCSAVRRPSLVKIFVHACHSIRMKMNITMHEYIQLSLHTNRCPMSLRTAEVFWLYPIG